MMKQYFAFKADYPEAVLLFRCGDFYETYGDDALIASKVLGIVLTKRSSAIPGALPMAGFPFHSLETYLPRLVRLQNTCFFSFTYTKNIKEQTGSWWWWW